MSVEVITSPDYSMGRFTSVFLGGGITNCKDWQSEVIEKLIDENMTIYNPRQKYFDASDSTIVYEQIEWEFYYLEMMDIFSMYFCACESDQPICMYELGRNIVRMQNRFPTDWEKRIIISVEEGYKRKDDVLIQTSLATNDKIFVEVCNTSPYIHAQYIKRAFNRLKN